MENNKETIYPENLEKGNYELNILLILSENDYCLWQDFLDDRLKMSQSTVSKYTRRLNEKGLIEKKKKEIQNHL